MRLKRPCERLQKVGGAFRGLLGPEAGREAYIIPRGKLAGLGKCFLSFIDASIYLFL